MFRFFRRRQKMVIIIMVVLMVAFLVGIRGVGMLFGTRGGKTVVGTTKAGKILQKDVDEARVDMDILTKYIGLGHVQFLVRSAGKKDASLAYAILLAEAKDSGVEVTRTDVESYLNLIGYPMGSDRYKLLIRNLRISYNRMSSDRFDALIERWLMVKEAFGASMIWAPPSGPRVERLFRDLNEKIELRVVKVPAEKFLAKQAEPTQQQIDELFNEFRGVAAGTYSDEHALGFAYRQPDRVEVRYLLIRKDVIARFTHVNEGKGREHYRRNESTFVKYVPVKPPEEKDKKKDRAVEYRKVKISLPEAMPQIMAELVDVEAQRRMSDLVGTVRGLVGDSASPGKDVYKGVMARLMLDKPAADALATRIAGVSIKNEPLSSAIDTLATSAGLKAIYYPWGRPVSKGKILPADKKVSLRAKQITLAEALERIGKDLKVEPIEWAMFKGFEGILFPLSVGERDVGMSPVSVTPTPTELLDEPALAAHVVLGKSFTSPVSGGRGIGTYAFKAEGLEGTARGAAVMSVGQVGPEMYVRGEDGKVTGRVLWQLFQVVRAHEPKELTESLKRQVIRDFKIRQAFATDARAFAGKVEADALKANLVAAATVWGRPDNVTGLFARKWRTEWPMPPAFRANDVPFMELPEMSAPQARRIREYIQRKVFALAPRNVEPPYPNKPKPLAVIAVAPLQAVFVVERIDYRPPVRSEYEQGGRGGRMDLTGSLMYMQRLDARRVWFGYDNIIKRAGFEANKP